MRAIILKAQFDGQTIRLDEPFQLPKNARLLVTVLPESFEQEDWIAFQAECLARAFGSDEPNYSEADLIA